MLIYSMSVSVDGFIADREGAFGWTVPTEELFRFHTAQVRELGGYLLGRRLYETMLVWETDPSLRETELRAAFADVWRAIPKVVFSRTLDSVPVRLRGSASMRVGVASHGAMGHIYPLLGFADALLAAGHDVIILTSSDLVASLTDRGYAAEAVGETIGWGLTQVQSRFPELTSTLPAEQAWRLDAELFADALPRAIAPALVTAFRSWRPELVLYESTNLGAVLAAAELNIPAVCLGLWAVGCWHVSRSELEQRVRAVWAERSAVPLTVDPLLGRAHLDPPPPSLRSPAATEGNSIRLPTRQIAWGDPRASLTSWLTRHHSRPVVYLTLGTVGWGTVDLVRDAIAGLTELAVDVLVATGSYFDPSQLGPLPDSVRVERFVRQDWCCPASTWPCITGAAARCLLRPPRACRSWRCRWEPTNFKMPKPWLSAVQESPCRKVASHPRRSETAYDG
jgi:dihydrofolate reductase